MVLLSFFVLAEGCFMQWNLQRYVAILIRRENTESVECGSQRYSTKNTETG
jgi:hypothetical protein